MLVTLSGIMVQIQPKTRVLEDVSIMASQSFLESYLGLFEFTSIDISLLQFAKAP